jgi:hypothetical protein
MVKWTNEFQKVRASNLCDAHPKSYPERLAGLEASALVDPAAALFAGGPCVRRAGPPWRGWPISVA